MGGMLGKETAGENKFYEFCNNIHIFINFIVLLVCIFVIGYFFKQEIEHEKTTGIIKEIKNGKCDVKERKVCTGGTRRHSCHESIQKYYHCEITVDYTIDNQKLTNTVITDNKNYNTGDQIEISYEKNNHNKIAVFTNSGRAIIIVSFIALLIYLFLTYKRFEWKKMSKEERDNSWFSFILKVGCFGDLFRMVS